MKPGTSRYLENKNGILSALESYVSHIRCSPMIVNKPKCTALFSILNIMYKLITPWTLVYFLGHESRNATAYTAFKCSTNPIVAYSQTHHIPEKHRLPGNNTGVLQGYKGSVHSICEEKINKIKPFLLY